MEFTEKFIYEAPTMVVVEAKTEGMICSSGGEYDPFNNNGGNEGRTW